MYRDVAYLPVRLHSFISRISENASFKACIGESRIMRGGFRTKESLLGQREDEQAKDGL